MLGVAPLFLFFVWIERQSTLPWIPQWLGWPWIFVDGELPALALWDAGLLLAAGAVQFLLARFRASVPVRLVAGGVCAGFVVSLWQNTGIALYQLVPHAAFSAFLSLTIFWGCLGTTIKLAVRWVGPPGMFAFRFDRSIYFLTVIALLASPMMTLDRIFVSVAAFFFPLFLRRSFTLKQ